MANKGKLVKRRFLIMEKDSLRDEIGLAFEAVWLGPEYKVIKSISSIDIRDHHQWKPAYKIMWASGNIDVRQGSELELL